jgi:hypothetical protein
MQLQERPGPPGPYAMPDEMAKPVPAVSTGGTRYADIEYARVMGYHRGGHRRGRSEWTFCCHQ